MESAPISYCDVWILTSPSRMVDSWTRGAKSRAIAVAHTNQDRTRVANINITL
ncbi:hypothetical protein AGABI1DRAFT_125908 [Agaricus bisporus var. burnettii JB137-S8]|uniref:Uncharacterized protein n=1 Tax=Agaricus bisporus var. burnettii (strain JB137-S8 / ATCC MYA-4627 / FGSC 10392) TaxID=597362 RepID=K5XEB6_AGABU|nr:uncharacterized protein AGABI1DRAFT_125908 [Agaricus bisporus var. burnettii JB137-S8]EKM81527.1 hypothetical protein AGABI1DRAFT_125908 [Agaricus bisporus var. burnettii JB137-S8]